MPTAKVTKNVSAAIGGGNVLCSTLISIKTKAWLYSFGERFVEKMLRGYKAVYKHITSTAHQINKFSSTSKPYAI